MKKSKFNNIWYILFIILIVTISGCNKKVTYSDSPYGDLATPAIEFLSSVASPTSAEEGDTVMFKVKGIPNDLKKLKFYLNQIPTVAVSYSDSLLSVIVPKNVTSGPLEIDMENGDHFIGPIVSIIGSITISTAFNVGKGTNGEIKDVYVGLDNNYISVGDFSLFNGHPTNNQESVNNILKINSTNGSFVNQFNKNADYMMAGSNGPINTICYTPGGFYMIGGSFNGYSVRKKVISNITRLNGNGSIDTSIVNKISLDPTVDYYVDTVPTFNSNFIGGSVTKIFNDANSDSSLIVIGNFNVYQQYDYANSTASTDAIYQIQMNQLARVFLNGSLDSSFNYNKSLRKSYNAFNGIIANAIQLSNNKIIVIGNFTTFDGVNVNRIARLNSDGLPDVSFNAGGTGADNSISGITYNATTKKILITGNFKNYNGVACNGIAMLNEDGSIDTSFKLATLSNGNVNYAGQLNSGLIVVSGTFSQYGGYVRQGFMILNADGTLATKGLNSTGAFVGQINKIIESTSELGIPILTLFGRFSIFDNQQCNNLVRIQFNP